jgi:DNA-binding beta-propeller fold protein YncE
VADTSNNRVEKFTSSGKFLQEWYLSETFPRGTFGSPNGLAIDSRGDIFVTDATSNTVAELAPSGATVLRVGWAGSQPGRLQSPEGIAVSSSGTIYVADTGNHRVEIFAPSGKVIGTIRKGLDAPADVLLAERRGAATILYVADSGSGRVLKFSVAS